MKTDREIYLKLLSDVEKGNAVIVKEWKTHRGATFQLIGQNVADELMFVMWKSLDGVTQSVPMDLLSLTRSEMQKAIDHFKKVN